MDALSKNKTNIKGAKMRKSKISKFTLEDLLNEEKKSALKKLEEVGAIIVKGIDRKQISRLYKEIKLFFNASEETKAKYHFEGKYWGHYIEDKESLTSCKREIFEIDRNYLDIEGLEQFDENSIPQGLWPSYQDFPNLQTAFVPIYNYWFELCEKLFGGVSQGFLTAFKYHPDNEAEYKISEHQDDHYVIAFAPLGEPLEIFIENKWFAENLSTSEALIVNPHIKHRVQNKTHKERYSVTFIYPIEPI